ncbi:hypothetical protein GE21DRAFT_6382 [Neurospora crassa]|uniref:Uncharacterized protein n=1 Tax=Neurospora crassa (strain ATCC 24698 / 74-OR23-1A / CBS 708.71 / DSM 1257 / FGSC 987) TaxID=367110 RepID=Q7SA56_NEUCR|nr:hypothetical protein NCU07306 [Neurospora crassa OR74A]EAA33228.2 hypothetical protein NCU07306 [Neurospora crassa OR74A]KHE88732.1 hypothetical protein GE21DRAFT_6382 [Neurospora crassa]|eukprot:XP_962464.2 hypothetical protein NCU07306 [Neurospora crassa OR74A]
MNKEAIRKNDEVQRRRWALGKIHAFKQSLGENEHNPSPGYALNKEPGYAKVVNYIKFATRILSNSPVPVEAHIWSMAYGCLFPVNRFNDELLRSVREQLPSVFEMALLCYLEAWEEWVKQMMVHCAQYLDYRLARLKQHQEMVEAMKGDDRAPGPWA